MSKMLFRALAGAAPLLWITALANSAVADDARKTIEIKTIHQDCDGEDCEDRDHRVLFFGDGGEIHGLEGHEMAWFSDGGGRHAMRFLGHGGAFLGVQLTELTDELRVHFGVPEGLGVMVSKVVDDSPAARAGIQVGDVITGVDGESVRGAGSLTHLIREREDGETVALELYRDGRIETLSPTLAEHERPRMRAHRFFGGHPGGRSIMVRCDDREDGEDCSVEWDALHLGDYDCGGAENCKVKIECGEAGCECEANGETVDCEEIEGFEEHHGE